MTEPFGLQRFVDIQDEGHYLMAVGELKAGRKRSHWMWFVFPQLAGLGSSPMAQIYAVSGLNEARAYLAHPVLGVRLRECCELLLELPARDPVAVLGGIDAVKLRSSMTLFEAAAPDETVFAHVLDAYYDGVRDDVTLDLLSRAG